LFKFIRRGLAALWGGGAMSRRETPYFPEATRLFFLSPHILNSEQYGRLTQPYREHVWVYACINAIAQSISAIPLIFKTGTSVMFQKYIYKVDEVWRILSLRSRST